MKKLFICSLLAIMPSFLFGVYAPIKTLEPEEPFVIQLDGGLSFDSNLFSSDTNEIDTMVFNVSPRFIFKQNDDPTDFRAYYDLDLFYFSDRPSDDKLVNHAAGFSVTTKPDENVVVKISDDFQIIDNPEANLNVMVGNQTLRFQTDQSYQSNTFNARANIEFDENYFMVGKYRNQFISYDNDTLASLLDHSINLVGAEFHYAASEKSSYFLETRYQDVSYDQSLTGPLAKDSNSFFLLLGTKLREQSNLDINARGGIEMRDRDSGDNDTYPFLDGNMVYRTGKETFVSSGLKYSVKPTDNTLSTSDRDVAEVYMNVQAPLADKVVGALSISYADSDFNGKAGMADFSEQKFKIGLSAAYQYDENLAILGFIDYDTTNSDIPIRDSDRTKIGIFVRYSFGVTN